MTTAIQTAQTTTLFNAQALRDKLNTFTEELSDAVLERKEVIKGAILALLTGTHVFQYGPPGTAKSLLTMLIAQACKAKFFEQLLHRNIKPDNVFGVVNIKHLQEHGVAKLNTKGKLPEAEFAFLDEFFKCNPHLLNAFLTLLNERKFDDGEGTKQVPLWVCFAASNEIPVGEPILEALYDRLLQRFTTPYIQDDGNFDTLLADELGEVITSIDLADLKAAKKEIEKVELGKSARQAVINVKSFLEKEKGIIVSDRRWKASMVLAKAQAWLNNRNYVSPSDLIVLRNTLWNDPSQLPAIDEAMKKLEDPALARVRELAGQFDVEYAKINGATANAKATILTTTKDIGRQIRKAVEDYQVAANMDSGVLVEMTNVMNRVLEKQKQGIAAEARRTSM